MSAIKLILFISVSFQFIACTRGQTPPLQIATNVWPGYEPIYLARELGYLSKDDYRIVELSSATEVTRAFRNRSIDAGVLTLDEVLRLAGAGFEIMILFLMDESHGADVLMASKHISSVKELKGKRVAVEENALGAYMLARILEMNGLQRKDVTPVYMEIDRHYAALVNGDVEAVITFEPVRSRLLDSGAKILFDSTKIPGEIFDVFFIGPRLVETRTAVVKNLVDAWFSSLDYMKSNPDRAFQIMGAREGISAKAFQTSLSGLKFFDRTENRRLLVDQSEEMRKRLERLQRVMLDQKLLPQPTDFKKVIGFESLRKVL